MAKLRAHGVEVGTIYGLTQAKRYMSDGHVLKNVGFGWKLYKRLKSDVAPLDAYTRAAARLSDAIAANPAWAAYRKELHATAGLSLRWKLHSAIQLMPDDPDGVWSEVCDGYGENVHADLEEISALCRSYQAMRRELEANRPAAALATVESESV